MDSSPSRRASHRSSGSPERRSRRRSRTSSRGRRVSRSRSGHRRRSRSYSPPERSSEESSPTRRRHRSRSGSSSPDRRSRRRSRGRERWECRVCRSAFRSNPALQDHIRSGGCRYARGADDVKIHKCYYCREEFSSARSLMAHIADMQHQLPKSTIKAIQSDDSRSSSSSNLAGSMDKLILLEKPAEEIIQCQICPKRFFDRTALLQHMAALNHYTAADREKGLDKMFDNAQLSKSGTYTCTVCRKTFLDKKALQFHASSTGHFPPEAEGRPSSSSSNATTPSERGSSPLPQGAPPPPVVPTRSGGRFVQSLVTLDNNQSSRRGVHETVKESNDPRSPGVGSTLPFPFPTDPPQARNPNTENTYRVSRFTSPPASPGANEQYLYSLMVNSPEPSPTAPVFSEVDRMWNIRSISFDGNRQAASAMYRNSSQTVYPPAQNAYYDRNAYNAAPYPGQCYNIPNNSRPIESLSERTVIIPQNYIPTANAGTPYMGTQPQYGAYRETYDNRPNMAPEPSLPQDPRRKLQNSVAVDSRKDNNSPSSSDRSTPSNVVAPPGPPLAPLDDMMSPRMITGSFTRTTAVQQRVPGTALPGPAAPRPPAPSPPVLRTPVPSPPILRPPVPSPPVRPEPEGVNVFDSRSNIPRAMPEVPVINAHSDRFVNTQPAAKPVPPFRVEGPSAGPVPPVPVVVAPPPPTVPVQLRIPYDRVAPPIPLEELPTFSPEVEPPPVEDDRPVTPETPTLEPEDPFAPQKLPVDDGGGYSTNVLFGSDESEQEEKETPVVSKRDMLLSSVPEFCLDCNNRLDPVYCLSFSVVHRRWNVCCLGCGWETVARA